MSKWSRWNYLPGIPLGKDGRRVTASPEHIAISRNAAKEGMVLLKNEKQVLPLAKGTRVALFGKATIDYVKGGGGSGDVTVPYTRNLYEGFVEVAGEDAVFPGTVEFYKKDVAAQYAAGREPGMTAEPELPDALLRQARLFTDTAIISICRYSGEGWDRKADFDPIAEHKGVLKKNVDMSNELFPDGDFYFSRGEREMLEKVSKAFGKVIVVLNIGGMVESAWLQENPDVDSVLLAWQGGMEGGLAEAELLMGLGNPSGKLSDTFARELRDYPCAEAFYESDDYVDYPEDIYVGYRYFETVPGAAEKVVYPFGYGLSYTSFALSEQTVALTDTEVTACVKVLNTGAYPGKEVVQVYYSAPQGKLGKPAKVLGAYRKTKLLAPGESQVIVVRFPIDQMASYDDLGKVQKSAWLLEQGEYRFYVGTSVRDVLEAETVLTLAADKIVAQLSPKMVPTQLKQRMLSDGSFEALPQGTPNDPNENGLVPMEAEAMQGTLPAGRAMPGKRVRWDGKADNALLLDVHEGRMTLEEFIAQLSDEDLAHLMGGQPNTGLANTYGYGNNPKFGIPNIMTADGPAGVRFWPTTGVTTTAFPVETLIACSWDPEVAYAVGEAGALECKENNIAAWLTPAVCIHRNPLCGRNFEYFSEDPLLTGKQAGALVKGIQSQRIAATPKHFALNNKESNRKNSDSRVSERAIREIYLKQFEIIVREAHPWTIMSSYNIINGHRASENREMLTGILRDEWGWDGMVCTDWWTMGEQYKEAAAGNDMKMGCGYPDRLLEALGKGLITRAEMETCVKRILTLILRVD